MLPPPKVNKPFFDFKAPQVPDIFASSNFEVSECSANFSYLKYLNSHFRQEKKMGVKI